MSQKPSPIGPFSERLVRAIRRVTRKRRTLTAEHGLAPTGQGRHACEGGHAARAAL